MGSRDIKGGKPFSSTGVGKARGKNKRTDWGAQQWKEGWEEGKGKEMAGAAGQGMKAAPVTCKMKLHTAAAPGAHLGQGALCLCFSNKWGLVALLASPTWKYILFFVPAASSRISTLCWNTPLTLSLCTQEGSLHLAFSLLQDWCWGWTHSAESHSLQPLLLNAGRKHQHQKPPHCLLANFHFLILTLSPCS